MVQNQNNIGCGSSFDSGRRIISVTERMAHVVSDKWARMVSFRQESRTRVEQARKWALACIVFADTHGNQLPLSFGRATGWPATTVSGSLTQSNWEIVSGGNLTNLNCAQTILLREIEPQQAPDGEFVKVYAFTDGHTELIRSTNKDFASLEKQRGFVVCPATN
jgi:hypothetical protein